MTQLPDKCRICGKRGEVLPHGLWDQTTGMKLLESHVMCEDCMRDVGQHLKTMQEAYQEIPGGWK